MNNSALVTLRHFMDVSHFVPALTSVSYVICNVNSYVIKLDNIMETLITLFPLSAGWLIWLDYYNMLLMGSQVSEISWPLSLFTRHLKVLFNTLTLVTLL